MTAVTTVLAGTAAVVSVFAAARSTWSPCGVSMLASITPLAERGRGHRYRTTAAWFVAGSVAGGLTLGLAMAGLAAAVMAISPGATTLLALACAGAALAAVSDSHLAGVRLPIHQRQVNERWLDQFRPWVYGAGFGWQIGVGLATYIKTAAVYLMVVLVALSGDPGAAIAVGVLFGLVRGLAVLLGRRITSLDVLARFHRAMDALDGPSAAVVVAVEVVAAIMCGWLLSPLVGGAVAVPAAGLALWRARPRFPERRRTART